MYVLENLHWFALLIGALVFFHELGHFLVAKAFGVKVLRFSLGFGPKLFGFTYGETEYWVSALPLGGYVKMLGDTPGSEVSEEEKGRSLYTKPVWQRSLVMFAGPGFNFLLAFLVYVGMLVGNNTFGDTRLGVVTMNEPAWQAGLRPGDKIIQINNAPIDDWEALRVAVSENAEQSLHVVYERQGQKHSTEITPQKSLEKNVFQETETRGKIGISLNYIKPIIAVVDSQSPAALAGFKTNDVIVRVQNKSVTAWHELRDVLATLQSGPITFEILRDKKPLTLQLTPSSEKLITEDIFSSADALGGYTGLVSKDSIVAQVEPNTPAANMDLKVGDRLLKITVDKKEKPIGAWNIDLAALQLTQSEMIITWQHDHEILSKPLKLQQRSEQDELKNTRTTYIFGATNDSEASGIYTYDRSLQFPEACRFAARQVLDDATLIAKGLAKLVRGKLPLDSMGGPIMLFVIAEKSAKKGAETFLRTMAVISVNLGLVNLLPVPALDGGHLLFCAIEAISRRPPSLRVREIANTVGVAMLILLMLLAFKNDILRYVLGS